MPSSSITKAQRLQLIWRKAIDNRCAHCGKITSQKTVDHFIPKVLGGGNDKRNLMPVCMECNKARGSEIVDPSKFYRYAHRWAIHECRIYLREWKRERTSLTGYRHYEYSKPSSGGENE